SSFGSYLSYFQNHDYLYGKKVRLDGQGSYLAMGIDEEFRLLLKGKNGIFLNASGEVRIDE
ncbi:MAG: hypothetical protein J6038_04180, partial [Bacilli bacterium]|nr:hypothetical protein [Bacilli bacterium]